MLSCAGFKNAARGICVCVKESGVEGRLGLSFAVSDAFARSHKKRHGEQQ